MIRGQTIGAAPAAPGTARIALTVLVPFGLGYYLSYLYRTVNVVLAPDLARDLGLGPADLGLLTSVYFIVFAAVQLPLGVLLDRYGPRRVQSALLLFAAAGSALFAVGEDFVVLTLGRGLIGLGVCGGLMAALKANVLWWPRERLPLINGLTAAFGSFGALSATMPVEWLLGQVGWRAIFGLLAAATLALVLLTFLLVPEKPAVGEPARTVTLRGQVHDMGDIFRNGFFWRVAVLGCLNNAAFLGYQTLWMGAWLRDVAGMAPPQMAEALLLFNIGMFAGVVCLGAIAERLQRLGIATTAVIGTGVALSLAVQAAMALEATGYARLLCIGFGFFGSSVLLNFSLFGQYFPAHIVGRANSAQNMLTFVASFVGQWGVGAIISRWPPLADGRYDPAGHRAALITLMALEALALIWFLWPRRAAAGWTTTERTP